MATWTPHACRVRRAGGLLCLVLCPTHSDGRAWRAPRCAEPCCAAAPRPPDATGPTAGQERANLFGGRRGGRRGEKKRSKGQGGAERPKLSLDGTGRTVSLGRLPSHRDAPSAKKRAVGHGGWTREDDVRWAKHRTTRLLRLPLRISLVLLSNSNTYKTPIAKSLPTQCESFLVAQLCPTTCGLCQRTGTSCPTQPRRGLAM